MINLLPVAILMFCSVLVLSGTSNASEHNMDEDFSPVDVDVNLVKSFLDSFSSQQGLPVWLLICSASWGCSYHKIQRRAIEDTEIYVRMLLMPHEEKWSEVSRREFFRIEK